ncbi:double zinc ribbon domain-containing protein [Pseudarthrobacter raffinosi]|uniref:double zinc ribbon domain-containing protein n=1 Tax=Pseudarthrobacter raffinosi TaxID=2953651 RepID=UPI0035AB803E
MVDATERTENENPPGAGDTTCPFCKEVILAGAVKCKHCGSRLAPDSPSHGGQCPYCREQIHPEATVCKHCKSSLLTQPIAGANLGGASTSGCQDCTPPGSDQSSAPYVSRAGRNCVRVLECNGADPPYRVCAWKVICVGLTSEGKLDVDIRTGPAFPV